MKRIILPLMLLIASFSVQAQCVDLNAKSYNVTFKHAGYGKDLKHSYILQFENKTTAPLEFVISFWGKPDGAVKDQETKEKVPEKVLATETFKVAAKSSTSKNYKNEYMFGDMKMVVNNPSCKDSGKNKFSDPTFYKLK